MKSYDLSLPKWGPYNKKYLGAAHIAEPQQGFRFDVNLFPGYYRRSVMTPRDLADCGAKMMASSVDLTHFVYRYELEWKDQVYVEADYSSRGNELQIACNFVNQTDQPESLSLNVVMSLQRPSKEKKELVALQVQPEGNTQWIDALDYVQIHNDQVVASDGLLLGECRGSGFVGGSYLGGRWFGKEGDWAQYQCVPYEVEAIGLRYRGSGRISIKIKNKLYNFELEKAGEPKLVELPISKGMIDEFTVMPHGSALDIDGFVLGSDVRFDDGADMLEPGIEKNADGTIISFGSLKYKIEYDVPGCVWRVLHAEDVGVLLSQKIHDHVSLEIGDKEHTHVDLFIRPVFVDPKSSHRIKIRIKALNDPDTSCECETGQLYRVKGNQEGRGFELSQNIMSAVTLTNVVWPIYCKRGYIRHNTPGRNWDSLYTWDSGFIGMGLLQMDTKRAEECLNAYLTPVGDIHSPYIFHGTPLPTQIFLWAELVNRTGNIELIRRYYPMIRQQYRFFANARFKKQVKANGLFNTWQIFYNSGGWDDYPTQVYVHQHHLEDTVCPMVNVSVTVLCGKILKMMAGVIGEDTTEYDEDIRFYSQAVEKYGWDETSGYYGYVQGGSVLKIDGVNANMGMDGVYPYIACISAPKRAKRIADNIKKGLMTPIGISVVDIRAPYFKQDGYWNGSVWMPHQWILWKALLDHGETDMALQIANTALQVWKKEVDLTYNCYEHFMLANGRGAGFHQFSGLSTPVLMWYNALYRPFSVTGGFQTLIRDMKIEEKMISFRVQAKGERPTILVCLEEEKQYEFNTSARVIQRKAGLWSLQFDGPSDEIVEIGQVEEKQWQQK